MTDSLTMDNNSRTRQPGAQELLRFESSSAPLVVNENGVSAQFPVSYPSGTRATLTLAGTLRGETQAVFDGYVVEPAGESRPDAEYSAPAAIPLMKPLRVTAEGGEVTLGKAEKAQLNADMYVGTLSRTLGTKVTGALASALGLEGNASTEQLLASMPKLPGGDRGIS